MLIQDLNIVFPAHQSAMDVMDRQRWTAKLVVCTEYFPMVTSQR